MILFAIQGFFTISEAVLAAIRVRWNNRILALLVSIFFIVLMVPTLSAILSNRASVPSSKKTPFGSLIETGERGNLESFSEGSS